MVSKETGRTNMGGDNNFMNTVLDFYKDKTVFLTGHTGFKGTWLTRTLLLAGAKVVGYSLNPPTDPALFNMAGFDEYIESGKFKSVIGDVRDLVELSAAVKEAKPDILFHLAAQPIVRDSYKDPVYTYETNVMGTVNVMESVRQEMLSGHKIGSVVIITTDKVYKNVERDLWGYREYEELDGYDPYSNSKSCAELAVHSYRDSFFKASEAEKGAGRNWIVPISTARAGNVIGGGDFANDRIIPDSVRAVEKAVKSGGEAVIPVRNPFSTRPYQHVLEPLAMYLTIAKKQYEDDSYADWYNVGPDDCDCVTTGDLVTLFCDSWNRVAISNDGVALPRVHWENKAEANAPHEAGFLKLDSTKVKVRLGYKPRWHINECMDKTVEFSKVYLTDSVRIPQEMDRQIGEFFNGLFTR